MIETTSEMYIAKETGTHLLHEWEIPIYFHALQENEKKWTGMINFPFYTVNTTKRRKTTNHSLTSAIFFTAACLALLSLYFSEVTTFLKSCHTKVVQH